ncbi:serine/threonine-protein kinase mig-15-like [Xenopus laevis]|uniref:Serine/threonine-protein kinase mig-15-like n=1 Tax=Xenopus laevis TaxID=8355 RepID=A0A8J1LAT8_XENLA|nr:serine/threonine-protein kinase mig-15-like [Xenopus laevis]
MINTTKGQSLRETWIGYVCKEVLKALKHIHKNRAVHRDIKSPNIMLTEKGKVKLIDFGLCWDLDPQTGKCYESEGTAHWMAPEAIRRRGKPVAYDTKVCCTPFIVTVHISLTSPLLSAQMSAAFS